MDNGVTQAETLHLSIGVELSKEQTAALTSDILWLVKEKVNGEDVLVPKIYLARLSEKDITPKGAVITGSDVEIYSGKTLKTWAPCMADIPFPLQHIPLKTEKAPSQETGFI